MKQRNTVQLVNRGTTPQPTRQDIDTQIAALKLEIDNNLLRVARNQRTGKTSQAVATCEHIARQATRIRALVAVREELQSLEAKPTPIIIRKPANQTIVQRKTYKRFARK